MTDYPVLMPVNHDGVLYVAGDTLALSEAQAAPLLAVNAIGQPVTDDEPINEFDDDDRADDPDLAEGVPVKKVAAKRAGK